MSKLTNILLLAGAAVGLYYLPTILGLYNLEVTIVQVLPERIQDKVIDFVATIKLKNKTGVRLNIQRIGADITLNNIKIAQFEDIRPMTVMGNSESNFNVAFSVDMESLGAELWTEFIAQNLQNFVIDAKGSITTNGKTFPFDATWTIDDFVNGTGIGSTNKPSPVELKFMRYFGDGTWELVEPFGDLWKSRGNKLYIRSKHHNKDTYNYLERQKFVDRVYEAGGDNVICVYLK